MSCQGIVKSFNESKGWGFINSDGVDVFVHIKDCQGAQPQVGDTVAFELDAEKHAQGQMKATDVSGCTGVVDNNGKGKGNNGGGKGKGGYGPIWGGCGGCGKAGTYEGTVRSFNDTKGWGFITSDGNDVFVHVKDCVGGQPMAGDWVSFDAEENPAKPGSLKAKNVQGGSGWPAGKGTGCGGGGCGGCFGAWGSPYGGIFGGPGCGFKGGFGKAFGKGKAVW